MTSSIESNNLYVEQLETIQVDDVPPELLCAIWLQHQRKKVYSPFDCTYKDNTSSFNTERRLTNVAFTMQV